MDMNKAYVLKKEARQPQWHVIDATDKVLGRLATDIAFKLRGKDRAGFTPHTDSGDYVVVINCEKVKLTGNKWADKVYKRYSGWRSGLKTTTAEQMRAKKPEELFHLAVYGMMPKNRLTDALVKKLKVYAGSEHPHAAQIETSKKAVEQNALGVRSLNAPKPEKVAKVVKAEKGKKVLKAAKPVAKKEAAPKKAAKK